jgi:uncharacterized membrane protein YoaK (UPF0700 family)
MSRESNDTDGDIELGEGRNFPPPSSFHNILPGPGHHPQDALHTDSAQAPEENSHQLACQVISAEVPVPVLPPKKKPSGDLPAQFREPGDYEHVKVATILWASYMSLICGCINAVSSLTYTTYLTHVTGTITRFSIGLVDSSQAAREGFSTANQFGIIISYCAGALTTGLVMTTYSPDGKWSYLRFKYPSTRGWLWQHQLLLSVSMTALATAYSLMRSDLPNFPTYITEPAHGKSSGFVAAIMLTAFAAALLNGFLTLNQVLVMRSAHHTGTLFDMFYYLGYSLRARNCRFFWKIKLLSCLVLSFVGGICIGAATFSAFHYSSVLVPLILLAPIWIMGFYLIVLQRIYIYRARRDIAPKTARSNCAPPQTHVDIMQSLTSILAELNLTEHLQKFKDDDRDDDSLKTLSRLTPERIMRRYGMNLNQAAAFLDKCLLEEHPQRLPPSEDISPSDDLSMSVARAHVQNFDAASMRQV